MAIEGWVPYSSLAHSSKHLCANTWFTLLTPLPVSGPHTTQWEAPRRATQEGPVAFRGIQNHITPGLLAPTNFLSHTHLLFFPWGGTEIMLLHLLNSPLSLSWPPGWWQASCLPVYLRGSSKGGGGGSPRSAWSGGRTVWGSMRKHYKGSPYRTHQRG